MIFLKNNLRLTAAVSKVTVGAPLTSLQELLSLLDQHEHQDSDLTILPRLALSSPSSGSLQQNPLLLSQSEQALEALRERSHSHSGYLMVGLLTADFGRPVSTMAVLHQGEIVAKIPLQGDPPLLSQGVSDPYIPRESVFSVGSLRIQLFGEPLSQLAKAATTAAENLCDLLVVPLYEPMVAGGIKELNGLVQQLSRSLGIAIALVNGGIGDTSFPYFYHGFLAIYEAGTQLAFQVSGGESIATTVDLDPDILRASRRITALAPPTLPFHQIRCQPKEELLRPILSNPFLPTDSWEKAEYIAELFFYQGASLASRMTNTGIRNLVIGVSGGMDSTAALMVAVAACDRLGLPRKNIHGVTLPGLGTSDETYYNAQALLEQLQVTRRDISIRPAVLQHFQDLGHSGNPDTTYENAQARERTQILLDLANMVGGLVVGTSDLSEEALGFCTFGGDHLANYNVNVCMTKTMLREELAYLIESGSYPEVSEILGEVLNTPISPELLPPSPNGEITQRTEEILGPYQLHEFFLYYFVAYKMRPRKIYQYACQAFSGQMPANFIKEKLQLFLKRFCQGQFKRSCAPDAAAITQVNLLSITYEIPSDLNPESLLADLEDL